MNFQFSLEKINKFGQKAKILQKNENAHEIRKKTVYVRVWSESTEYKVAQCAHTYVDINFGYSW